MSKKMFVGNLPYKATSDDLRNQFVQFGQVEDVTLITERETGKSKGYGFVTMRDDKEADEAIAALSDSEFMGRKLTVNEAQPRNDRGGDRGGRRGGR